MRTLLHTLSVLNVGRSFFGKKTGSNLYLSIIRKNCCTFENRYSIQPRSLGFLAFKDLSRQRNKSNKSRRSLCSEREGFRRNTPSGIVEYTKFSTKARN